MKSLIALTLLLLLVLPMLAGIGRIRRLPPRKPDDGET